MYAKEKVTCGAAGGQMGAINPKTLRKYIWPMIKALAGLEPYKVCILLFIAILGNTICWVSSPHPAGKMGDLEIFRRGLLHHLDEEERVEADDGYEGEAPLYVC